MSHEGNNQRDEYILEWCEEDWAEYIELDEMTMEQMRDLYECYTYTKDPDAADQNAMDYLEELSEKNPRIWKK